MSHTNVAIRRTEEEIAHLVRQFENCTLAPSAFNHHAHMTVALWYLMHLPAAEAYTTMRTNIQHFAAQHGHTNLYHETITLFWLKLLRHFLDVTDQRTSLAEQIYQALLRFGSMRFVFAHYSKEFLFSEQARQEWVEPDLLPLAF